MIVLALFAERAALSQSLFDLGVLIKLRAGGCIVGVVGVVFAFAADITDDAVSLDVLVVAVFAVANTNDP